MSSGHVSSKTKDVYKKSCRAPYSGTKSLLVTSISSEPQVKSSVSETKSFEAERAKALCFAY